MYHHPETMLLLAGDIQRALIAEADQERLLNSARRARRARRAGRVAGSHRATRHPAGSSAPTGTLAPCAPTAVPAR